MVVYPTVWKMEERQWVMEIHSNVNQSIWFSYNGNEIGTFSFVYNDY